VKSSKGEDKGSGKRLVDLQQDVAKNGTNLSWPSRHSSQKGENRGAKRSGKRGAHTRRVQHTTKSGKRRWVCGTLTRTIAEAGGGRDELRIGLLASNHEIGTWWGAKKGEKK